MEATILNSNPESDRLVPRITAPPPPGPPTASEAMAQYFEDHSWDKSLKKSTEFPEDI